MSKGAGGQAFFECFLFQPLSTIKVKLVDKMMQSAYLYVVLHVKHKSFHFLRFNLISNSW